MRKNGICVLFLCVLFLAPSGAQERQADADTSYAFGVILGTDLRQTGLRFDFNSLIQGLRESAEAGETRMTQEEALAKIQAAYAEVVAARAAENKQREIQFFAENGKKPGIITTPSGLQYEVVTEGTGPRPAVVDRVSVNYEGSLIDGTVIDSSYTEGKPMEIALSDVIPGWTEGLQLMRVGGTYRLFIPSALAYGERGAGGFIPPNATLIFKVELLAIAE